jgi:hypothetical protein
MGDKTRSYIVLSCKLMRKMLSRYYSLVGITLLGSLRNELLKTWGGID